MLRDAINEIRLHPGRFVATLLAIAISVGFLVAIGTMTATTQLSTARENNLALAKADVVVEGVSPESDKELQQVRKTSGVKSAEPSFSTISMMSTEDRTTFALLVSVPGEDFRWAELTDGRWADNPSEVTLSRQAADELKVGLGDKVFFSGAEQAMEVVGITRDAKPLFSVVVYSGLANSGFNSGTIVVRTDGTSPEQVRDNLSKALGSDVTVKTGHDARIDALNDLTEGFDVFRALLYVFGAIAMLVGAVIIANTFTILFTQRRRQIALLRAVGASSGQVRGRLILEALVLGLLGSLLGVGLGLLVAWAGAHWTGAIYWGLVIDWTGAFWSVVAGTLVTLIAVLGPSLSATQVKPIEALQVVPSAAKAKRLGKVRVVLCSAALLIGLLLVGMSLVDAKSSFVWAVFGGIALTVAILGMAPLYIPPLLRGLGKIFGFAGPTVRLAGENAARNPRRAGATAVALMMAVGLVVTLQVGASTVRSTAMDQINAAFPVDVAVSTDKDTLPAEVREKLERLTGKEQLVDVQTKRLSVENSMAPVVNANPGWRAMGHGDLITEDVALVREHSPVVSGNSIELPGVGTVPVREDRRVEYNEIWVSESLFQRITADPGADQIWIKVKDRTDMTTFTQLGRIIDRHPDLYVSGGFVLAGALTQVVNVLLMVVTALLGVAVLIALVGVGNTLGLSVLERQRESALLRALGMQRSSLRLMLLTEALMLALVGTVIGVLAGAFMGWLGVASTFRMIPETDVDLKFSVDVGYTAGLIGVCVLAACLASVLPGRRAANATPTEALAAE